MTCSPYATALFAALVSLSLSARAEAQQALRLELSATPGSDRRSFEALAFYASLGVYGARTGAVLNEVSGVQGSRDLLAWAVLPTLLGSAGLAIAWAMDHPRRLRRGHGFAVAAGLTLGGISMSSLGFLRGDARRVPGDPFTSPLVWLGSTAGLAAGLISAEVFDPTAGSGTLLVTFGVGGALSGAALCGIAACGNDLGYFVFGGELALTATGLMAIALVHPSEAEVRWTVFGALVGSLPGALSLLLGPSSAFDFRGDNSLGFALSLGGLLGGGLGSLALARALGARHPDPALRSGTQWAMPTLSAGQGSLTLGIAMGM